MIAFATLDLAKAIGYYDAINTATRQDETRNMTRVVGRVSRTTKASPPAG